MPRMALGDATRPGYGQRDQTFGKLVFLRILTCFFLFVLFRFVLLLALVKKRSCHVSVRKLSGENECGKE